jgi:hypothetical protein
MERFELWDVSAWDMLRVERLVMGRFESGTFSDGTFCMCIVLLSKNVTSLYTL